MRNQNNQQAAEAWINRYSDTHTEFQAIEHFTKKPNLIGKDSTDTKFEIVRGVKQPAGKREAEIEGKKQSSEHLQRMMYDLVQVRLRELLDKNEFPIHRAIDTIIRLSPQKVEQKTETIHTFAEAVKRAKLEFENCTTVDAEGVPIVVKRNRPTSPEGMDS